MIPLKTLITLAPFSPEMKEKLIGDIDTFPEMKKMELVNMCWTFIIQECDMKVQFAREDAMAKMALGEGKSTPEDFQKIEDDMYDELAKKVQAAGEEGSLEEVRDKLTEIRKDLPKEEPKDN